MNLSDFSRELREMDAEKEMFFRAAVNDIAARVLSQARKLTPVSEGKYEVDDDGNVTKTRPGGELRRKWSMKPAAKMGRRYRAIVINNAKYASYVEHGHRQNVGQFVPVLGKRLVEPWVPGVHMLQLSHNAVERKVKAIVERRFRRFLKGHLK